MSKDNTLILLYKNLGLSRDNGLIQVKGHANWEEQIPAEVRLSLKVKKQLDILQPDTFYHFHNTPLILFFDNPADNDIPRIHKQAWCFNRTPVIFISRETNIDVYNAFHYEGRGLKTINIDEEDIVTHFSFWELRSGNTWKWIEENFFKGLIKKHRVDTCLLDNIRAAVRKLENKGIPLKTANVIILRLIFIRYLIDRGVIMDEKFIEGDPSEKENRKESFNCLIPDRERLYLFFDHLKERFNGNLFERHNDEAMIRQEHLELLSMLFRGQSETGERFLFDVYDFSIIPIELISGIYESIIDDKRRKENAAIYTPTFLVDLILRQTVEPYLEENGAKDCKVLDPACGSGIFLVEAYRRIVEREMSRGKISDDRLKGLLVANIYGIDKDESALNVAIFSLYIALLDYKEPKDIKKFKLPELLNKRLFTADFFDTAHPFNEILKKAGLNFIIGNPPWRSDKSTLHKAYIGKGKTRLPVSRYEISQTFLIRTKDFHGDDLKCGLIVSSKAFYDLWAKDFKRYFFKNFYVGEFFDLSPTRRIIFEEALNPATILVYKYASGRDTRDNIVKHCSIKPNLFLENFNTLVIEKYDQKTVAQKLLIQYDWLLKVLLYGNLMDFHFLNRLKSKYKTISRYIDSLNENGEVIYYGDGIKKLTPNAKEKLSASQKEKIKPFVEIGDTPIIELEAINKYYSLVDKNHLPEESDLLVKSGRRKELYEGCNTVLLKARPMDESELVVSYVDAPCVYREKTLGITSKNNLADLKYLYGILNTDVSTYFQFLTSAAWGIFYPEIAQHEYLSFPYVEVSDRGKFIELVNRLLHYYKERYSGILKSEEIPLPNELRQMNQMVNEAFEIDDIEKDLIDYALDVSRYLFQEGKAYKTTLQKVEDGELEQYGQIFYDHFSSIYNSPGEYFQVEYFHLDYFIAVKFKIVPDKPSSGEEIVRSDETNPEKIIFNALAQKTSLYKLTDNLYINKVIKGFEEDFFYIIKPNELKSWRRAIAHLDLAEFIDALNKAESKEMKEKNNG